jgi:hypothetical protein
MSYTRDRSSRTRGVGAVAATDLREGRGGAVVRTGHGSVRIVPKTALGATFTRRPKKGARDIWAGVRIPSGRVRPGMGRATASIPMRHVVTSRGTVILTGGNRPATQSSPNGAAVDYSGVRSTAAGKAATTSYGGGGGGGGGGGPMDFGPDAAAPPDDEAAIREQEAAAAASQPDAGPEAAPDAAAAVKPPMSTGTKVAAAAGVGWLLLKMLGKGF